MCGRVGPDWFWPLFPVMAWFSRVVCWLFLLMAIVVLGVAATQGNLGGLEFLGVTALILVFCERMFVPRLLGPFMPADVFTTVMQSELELEPVPRSG